MIIPSLFSWIFPIISISSLWCRVVFIVPISSLWRRIVTIATVATVIAISWISFWCSVGSGFGDGASQSRGDCRKQSDPKQFHDEDFGRVLDL
ncbi:hypothetical protein GGI43DRAFT_389266 [Trichoderma evansii]